MGIRLGRQISGAVLVAWSALCAAAPAAEPQRQRIEMERQAIEAGLVQELAACAREFRVNDCADQAKARRREALRPLREQELILDAQARRERAAARQQAIAAKLGEREKRQADADSAAVQPNTPEPPESAKGRAEARAAAAPASRPKAAASAQTLASAAQSRASAARARQQAAVVRQARIAERERRREEAGKVGKAAPLPASP